MVPPDPRPGDTGSALEQALAAASSVAAACQTTVDHLVAAGLPLASLYLERGGRLRCYAVRGYSQVFDGMPPHTGVIGRTFRTGVPIEIRGVDNSRDYLGAVDDVVDEVCVPIRLHGREVGALNVESQQGLPHDALHIVSEAGARFSRRLAELGGPPEESAAERLARHAATLTAAADEADVAAAIVHAAVDLSGMPSALLALVTESAMQVVAATGPLGDRLTALDRTELEVISSWVESGTSSYSVGDDAGSGFRGYESLRRAGAATVVTLPVQAGSEPVGILLVVDEQMRRPSTELVERLELLAALAATALRTAQAMVRLREQASRDSLTGLGNHASFQTALGDALGSVPTGRHVAVVLIDVDHFKAVNDTHGHLAGDRLLRGTAVSLAEALRAGDRLYRIGGDEFATVLEVNSAAEAFAIANRLHAAGHVRPEGTTVSVGVAVAGSGESVSEVVTRADAALYAVKRAGRDGVRAAPPR